MPAFTRSTFARSSSHANPSAPVTWNYRTADAVADVNTAGYFNEVAGEVRVGDLIYALCGFGGTLAPAHFYVASNDGTTVDVANGDALTTTDSD